MEKDQVERDIQKPVNFEPTQATSEQDSPSITPMPFPQLGESNPRDHTKLLSLVNNILAEQEQAGSPPPVKAPVEENRRYRPTDYIVQGAGSQFDNSQSTRPAEKGEALEGTFNNSPTDCRKAPTSSNPELGASNTSSDAMGTDTISVFEAI
ncbi:hypothetical protein Daesc_005851 [Daldinia eschscholtzii]|uniref:Uncharacterized protein n=1 Tax=Daldinia eschscholtzii TaxID=292717 RepID=A0AAX6MM38_9PEZI